MERSDLSPLQLYTVAQQLVQSNSNICLFLRDPSSSVKQSLRSLAALAVLAECKPRLWMEKRAAFLSPGSGCLLLPTQNDFLNTPKEKALSITGILCLSNPASQSHSTNPTFLCSGYCWGCENSCIAFNKNLSPFSALNICPFWQLWPAAVIIPALKFQRKFKGKNRKCKRVHNNAWGPALAAEWVRKGKSGWTAVFKELLSQYFGACSN